MIALLAGCGGGGNDEEAREIVERGFSAPIGSARVAVDLTARLEGIPQQKGPVKIELNGPYRANGPGELPDADLAVAISGGGQTFSFGLLSTGERAYVRFGGTAYEIDRETVGRLNGGRSRGGSGQGLRGALRSRFGVDPLRWMTDLEDEGEAEVNGVETRHVRAEVDVRKALSDLNRVVERTADPGTPPPTLDDEQIESIAGVVDDPKLDVYVGADGRIRRVSLDFAFEVPEDDRQRLNGLKSGTITLDVELTEIGKPQQIEEPPSARPMSELNQLLGGRGILGLLFGLTTGAPQPGAPGSPTPEQLKAYRECIDRAKPSDTPAIERCNELLR